MSDRKHRWSITADKFLTEEQVSSLVEHLKEKRDLAIARASDLQAIRDYYIVRGLLDTGLRVSEFCALVNSDFCGHKLTVKRGKGDKARTVLLTKGSALMLNEWRAVKLKLGFHCSPSSPMFPSRYDNRYSVRGIQDRIKVIFAELGFSKTLSVHSLRHTYCSLLIASGRVGLATIRENMGHHSLAVTNLYAHVVGELNSDVELYSDPTVGNSVFSTVASEGDKKKFNSSVETFLRNLQLKPGEPQKLEKR